MMIMIKRFWTAAAATLALFAISAIATGADAQSILRVAAVVNDDVISDHDLDARVRLALFSSGIPVTPETRKRMQRQVLQVLIREKLQLQEARRLNIKVSREELTKAIIRLEKRNRMSPGKLLDSLKRQGIPPLAMLSQLNASMAWSKVVQARIRPFVRVSEQDVDGELERIKANWTKPRYSIAEIFLPVSAPEDEETARRTAQKLLDQIRRGARFGALARQFSQSPTARGGGVVGEVQPGQLDSAIDAAVETLKVGQVTGPIRTTSGYYIIQLLDRRTVKDGKVRIPTVTFAQVLLGYGGKPTQAAIRRQITVATRLGRTAKTCEELLDLGRKSNAVSTQMLRGVRIRTLAPALRRLLDRRKVNQASRPVPTRPGVQVFMVCSRAFKTDLPNRKQVLGQIYRRELSIRTQRYLRDLRRAANIDIREG